MLSEFDQLVKERGHLKQWWQLGSTICGWGGGYHEINLVVPKPTRVEFCGQAYVGAKNYHEAPEWFADAVHRAIQEYAGAIVKAAYETEVARLDEAIEKHRAAVLKELATM